MAAGEKKRWSDAGELLTRGLAGVAATWLLPLSPAQTSVADGTTLYLHPYKGADSNPGSKDSPLRTPAEAARRVNANTGSGPITIVLTEGIYALNEAALFQPKRPFTKTARLTMRAKVSPDDPTWTQSRMPALIHTMPLDTTWNGQPDPFGGVAYGLQTETSHVTIQGLKILGMPIVEHPAPGAIHRVYPIGRIDRTLEDLEIKQCLFAGDEVTAPNHCGILANGSGIVLDHCLFYNLKITVVFWTGGSSGHAMRNCLVYGAYGCGLWTSGIANDFSSRTTSSRIQHTPGSRKGAARRVARLDRHPAEDVRGRGGRAAPQREPVHYKLYDSLFTGNGNLTGTGGGPAINAKPTDPSFLELVNSKLSDTRMTLEMNQNKRNYLHAVEGTEEARVWRRPLPEIGTQRPGCRRSEWIMRRLRFDGDPPQVGEFRDHRPCRQPPVAARLRAAERHLRFVVTVGPLMWQIPDSMR